MTVNTSDADTITTPTNWNLFDSGTDGNERRYLYWRVLPGTGSVTFTGTSSGKKVLTWDTWDATDIDTTAPISTETPNEIVSGTTTTTRTNPTATLTGQPRYALAVVLSRGGSPPTVWTPPSGFTLGAAGYNTSSGATTTATAYRTYTATGSQGGGSWVSDTSEARGTTYLIILNPAAVPAEGTGALAYAFALTGNGSTVKGGTGALAYGFGLTGSAATVRNSTGALAYAFAVSGSGATDREATGTLAYTFTLTGTSTLPREGTGALAYVFALAGAGVSVRRGAGALGYTYAISGAGESERAAAGVLGFLFQLSGVAATSATGMGVLAYGFSLTGLGPVPPIPTTRTLTGDVRTLTGTATARTLAGTSPRTLQEAT